MSPGPILSVTNLKKHFHLKRKTLTGQGRTVYAVDGVSFSINEGETLGLVGESGSGKTTVGRCILRLIEPTAGVINFLGHDVTSLTRKQLQPLRKKMQVIFQDPYGSLTPRLRVSTLIREPLDVHGIEDPKQRNELVAATMQKVGLRPEHMHRYPHEFSGGQRQRISLARAIILNPRLIIADEPVSALDVSIRAQVLNLMADLQKEYGLSYLFISHDLSVVKYMCDYVAVMYLGKIVELAPRDELYENFKHPYTSALLSAITIPSVAKKPKRIILKGKIPSPSAPPAGCNFNPRCVYKIAECEQIEPQLKDIGHRHYVACHLNI